jgi:CBS domain-containing protein
MKVRELMTENPKACTPTSNLAEVARLMWENDCGILPVVAHGGRVVGLITDRDVCMAAAMKHRHLENIAVKEVSSDKVMSCHPDDDVRTALKTMQENKIRRLPVVANDGKLQGIVSMNDIVLRAQEARNKKTAEVSYADVVTAYKAICAHPLPMKQAQLAAGV